MTMTSKWKRSTDGPMLRNLLVCDCTIGYNPKPCPYCGKTPKLMNFVPENREVLIVVEIRGGVVDNIIADAEYSTVTIDYDDFEVEEGDCPICESCLCDGKCDYCGFEIGTEKTIEKVKGWIAERKRKTSASFTTNFPEGTKYY